MTNASKLILSGIIIALISSVATYSWNHQSIAEMVEEQNRETILTCISEARKQTTASGILQATKDCDSNLFTTIQSPLISPNNSGTVTPAISGVPQGINPNLVIKNQNDSNKNIQGTPQRISVPSGSLGSQKTHNEQMGKVQKTDTGSIQPTTSNRIGGKGKERTSKEIFEQIKHLGYRSEPTIALIQSCKDGTVDPRHCIVVGLTLMYNEAGNMQNSKACTTRNNCFGIDSGRKVYASLQEATDTWVVKYNKYWYKAQSASFFYSSSGGVSPSRYCTSEDSSLSSVGCPHGLSIATKKWNQLYPLIHTTNENSPTKTPPQESQEEI